MKNNLAVLITALLLTIASYGQAAATAVKDSIPHKLYGKVVNYKDPSLRTETDHYDTGERKEKRVYGKNGNLIFKVVFYKNKVWKAENTYYANGNIKDSLLFEENGLLDYRYNYYENGEKNAFTGYSKGLPTTATFYTKKTGSKNEARKLYRASFKKGKVSNRIIYERRTGTEIADYGYDIEKGHLGVVTYRKYGVNHGLFQSFDAEGNVTSQTAFFGGLEQGETMPESGKDWKSKIQDFDKIPEYIQELDRDLERMGVMPVTFTGYKWNF